MLIYLGGPYTYLTLRLNLLIYSKGVCYYQTYMIFSFKVKYDKTPLSLRTQIRSIFYLNQAPWPI